MNRRARSYPTDAFVDGEWIASATGRRFEVSNPATGKVIASVADCGADETRAAIEAAEKARYAWAARPAGERSKLLERWRDLLIQQSDDLAALLTAEMGKPLAEAKGEVLYGASYLDWFAAEAKRIYGDIIPSASPNNRIVVIKQPVGVCAAITPWNFPNAMLMRKVAAALAAGCTMVAKPAEDTPLSALAAAACAEEAGIPAGVFNVVPTSRAAEVGGELTSNPLIRKISFTGSTEVGKLLLRQSADTVKKVSMELGGNAPFIIFEDADLDAAINGLMVSKYRNAGQTCVCANRIIVHNSVMDEVALRFREQVAGLRVGPGDLPGSEVGPLINEEALAKTKRLVTTAIEAGAEILIGGRCHDAGPLFYAPTILKSVSADMDVAREEIFGPVAPLIGFQSEEEAIGVADETPFGLAAYFYTKDLGRAWRVAEALDYGMVGVNEGIVSSAAAPFGGVKQSGMGREGSRYGLDDYLEIKYMLMGGLTI